jgi:thioredoxin-like negative regulator of GroEL
MALIPGTTTAWEDIQVKLGNFAPREKKLSNDEIEQRFLDTVEANMLAFKEETKQEGSDNESDLEDIRMRRIQQLKQKKFLLQSLRIEESVNFSNFKEKVNEKSKEKILLLSIFSEKSSSSKQLNSWLDKTFTKCPDVLFARGEASAIFQADFPVSDLPLICVYHKGECLSQHKRCSIPSLQKILLEISKEYKTHQEDAASSDDHCSDDDAKEKYSNDREFSSSFLSREWLNRE